MKCKKPNPKVYQKFITIYGEAPVDIEEVKARLQVSGFEARNLIAHRQRMKILQEYKKLKNTRAVAQKLGMTTVYVNGILSYYGVRKTVDNQYKKSVPELFDPNNIITKYLFSNKLPQNDLLGTELSLPTSVQKLITQLEEQPSYIPQENYNDVF